MKIMIMCNARSRRRRRRVLVSVIRLAFNSTTNINEEDVSMQQPCTILTQQLLLRKKTA